MKRQLERGWKTAVDVLPKPGTCARIAALLALLLAAAPRATLAAPVNDNCTGAEIIQGAGPFPLTTAVTDVSTATLTGDPPLPPLWVNAVSRSVWYKITPAATANYRISTCSPNTTVKDTVIALYEAPLNPCGGPFTRLAFRDQEFACEEIKQLLNQDTTYFVVVWKYFDGTPDDGLNNLQLIVDRSFPPPNDSCATATTLHLNVAADGTTIGALNDYEITGTSGFWGIDQTTSLAEGPDVAYTFTAPGTGNYNFRVSQFDVSQNQNLVLYVLREPCPSGAAPALITSLLGAANRSTASTAEEVFCLSLTNEQQVIVIVDGDNTDDPGGTFRIEVTQCTREQEPNNSPANATPFSSGVGGSSSPQFDLDFYALGRYPAGSRAFVLVDGEAARITDFDLRITTATDTLEYDNRDNDGAFGDNAPNVAGTRLTGDPAFIQVNYLGGSEREPYHIYAVVQPPLSEASPEVEPNDLLPDASSSERNYFRGTLSGPIPSADVDVYAFGASEGDLIFLSLDADPYRTNAPINARLELLDGMGNPLEVVNDSNAISSGTTNIVVNNLSANSPTAPAESLVFRSGVEGLFYARVSISPGASGSSGAGHYLLSISRNGLTGSEAINHTPTLSNIEVPSPATVGTTVTLKGTAWEWDLGDATTLTVDWGDGTTNQTLYPIAGLHDFALPHQFNTANTTFTVTLTIADSRGASASATTNVTVRVAAGAARFTAITPTGNGQIHLELQATPLGTYRIEKCDTLGTGWTELGIRTAPASGVFSIDDPSPAPWSRFYRAVVIP